MDVFLFKHLLLLLRVFSFILVQRDTVLSLHPRSTKVSSARGTLLAAEEYLDALHSRNAIISVCLENNERRGGK